MSVLGPSAPVPPPGFGGMGYPQPVLARGGTAPGYVPDVITAGGSPVPTRLHVGDLPSGPLDGITDVPGIGINHITKDGGQGSNLHDGATVVMPNANPWTNKVAAASYTINGNGALTNHDWVDESGRLETPIVLVGNTLDVGRAYDGTIDAMIAQNPQIGRRQDVPLPVIGEIDGQRLNDAPLRAITAPDVSALIAGAHGGQFARGSIGAGTPSTAFGYKAGIGSSSRMLPPQQGGYTVGVLVNANMDVRRHLDMAGVPVGKYLPQDDLPQTDPQRYHNAGRSADGSIIIVVATDAPLTPLQLKELAKRTAAGLYRSGSISRLSSGDQVIAFSTSRVNHMDPVSGKLVPSRAPEITDEDTINGLFSATADATESAIDNSLLSSARANGGRAGVYRGNGSMVFGLPADIAMRLITNPPAARVLQTNDGGTVAAAA